MSAKSLVPYRRGIATHMSVAAERPNLVRLKANLGSELP
jgi:hypothetical protein